MSQEQFEAVKDLIQRKQIDKARMILEGIDTPKARRWLTELDKRPSLAAPSSTHTTPARVTPDHSMPDTLQLDEMDEIKLAIREKRYADADALLILSDHPDATKLRERLAQTRGAGTPAAAMPDFTNRLVVCIVLLFFAFVPGLIALEIFVSQARKFPTAPGAKGLLLTRNIAWGLTLITIVIGVACWALVNQAAQITNTILLTSSSPLR